MACRLTELVLDARDPELLARFWCEVLGYVELERDEASIEIGPAGVGFGGLQPTIVFSQTDQPKAGRLRLHIDVNATDREQDDELERLLAAGARRADIGQTGAEPWHVLADPEGNEFCLLRHRVPELWHYAHEMSRIFTTSVASVYPHYLTKVEKKGRTKAELDHVIEWLTGFDESTLSEHLAAGTTFDGFFAAARLNPDASLITGVVCGVRVEDVEDPLMRKIRYLDKLVDELARGKSMDRILRT